MKPALPSSDAFWVLSEAYRDAGNSTLATIRTGTYVGLAVVPCIFLYFRSIELALKAVLVYHGVTERDITRTLGHKISAILLRVERYTPLIAIGISADDRLILDDFSDDYSSKSFEYSDDWWQLPELEGLQDLADRVCRSVSSYERKPSA